LARALIALQASKIHTLEATADPTGAQTGEFASQDRRCAPPRSQAHPASREKPVETALAEVQPRGLPAGFQTPLEAVELRN